MCHPRRKGSRRLTYVFDPAGRLTSRTDATGTTGYRYDALSHLVSKTPAGQA
ncbi:MAG: RHS repeat protein, partial [Actinobacteria bacterium]|nr:RHS repeat protein [Actinomycetota bacterium]